MDRVVLTPEEKQDLENVQRMVHDILPQIDDLEKCGRNCADMRVKAKEIHEGVTKFLTHFSR